MITSPLEFWVNEAFAVHRVAEEARVVAALLGGAHFGGTRGRERQSKREREREREGGREKRRERERVGERESV